MNERNDRRPRSSGKAESCAACAAAEAALASGDGKAVRADAIEESCEAQRRRTCDFSDPVCISTDRIYDSCRDRDCVADQRVYLTEEGQALLEQAVNVKLKKAEVIWVFTDVESLAFQRGYFSVDLKFFVCVTMEVFCGVCNPTVIRGLTTYDKRIILYGSEGNSKQFSSRFNPSKNGEIVESWQKSSLPTVTVEVVEPVALSAKIEEEACCDCGCGCSCGSEPTPGCALNVFPPGICECFDGDLVVDDCARQVRVTYGLFFLVRLERESRLLVEAEDFCIPTRECPAATEEEPCELFQDIRFPIDEFYPPKKKRERGNNCGCSPS